ncbi:MAG TPA: flagellar basal body rod protein FlgB [Acidiferrobacteraceae bacterium]|mgnify:CR=1 FL=1|nr:flagellar basal body rod protein FlgB [Acidiferrobacteraceae bacterium]
MPLNLDAALGVHPEALQLRAKRTELLAANMANAETPGYLARDFNFQSALRSAGGDSDPGMLRLQVSQPGHVAGMLGDGGFGDLLYRVPTQPSIDGNTVDGQVEKAEFARNSLHYMASLTFLNGRISGVMRALRGE